MRPALERGQGFSHLCVVRVAQHDREVVARRESTDGTGQPPLASRKNQDSAMPTELPNDLHERLRIDGPALLAWEEPEQPYPT